MAVAEEEYVLGNESCREDIVSTSDNASYLSMNGGGAITSSRSSTYSMGTSNSGDNHSVPWPSAAATVTPASPAGVTTPAMVTAFTYPQIMLMLQDLTDFHYGIITSEMAEEVCSEFGEFLIHSRRFSVFDLTLTVKLQSYHAHYTIHKNNHPVEVGQHIYFLDDKTRQFLFMDVMDLIQFLVSARYLPNTPKGLVPLHPCLRSSKMVVNGVDISLGKVINPNPVSSKTYHIGYFKSGKAVLVKKRDDARVMCEANIRSKFHSHPNIVRMLGVSLVDPICLVLHEEARYSLYDYVKKLKSSKRNKMASICHNICCGMIYLHSHQCLLRSLLTRACIIDQSGTAKISDFDKSCYIEGESIEPKDGESVYVPTRWAAPEVLKNSRFSKSSDVWSFGVFVWEVFNNGKIPYNHLRNEQLLEKLKPGFRLTLVKKQAPYDIILEKCLRYNESNRPNLNFIEGTIFSLL